MSDWADDENYELQPEPADLHVSCRAEVERLREERGRLMEGCVNGARLVVAVDTALVSCRRSTAEAIWRKIEESLESQAAAAAPDPSKGASE